MKAVKVAQTFFSMDAQSSQPICFSIGSSARSVTQATPELLRLTQEILGPDPKKRPLVMADCEHFSRELAEHIQSQTLFDLLAPMPNQKARQAVCAKVPASQFTPRWAGSAPAPST